MASSRSIRVGEDKLQFGGGREDIEPVRVIETVEGAYSVAAVILAIR